MTKQCETCNQIKPKTEFYWTSKTSDRRMKWCKPCHPEGVCTVCATAKPPEEFINNVTGAKTKVCASCRARRLNNTDERKAKRQEYNRKVAYGMDPGDYQILLDQQEGCCAICASPAGDQQLKVDHCHDTKDIRGLLCNNCNVGIAMLKHDPELLGKAIDYLLGFRDPRDT